MWLLVSPAGGVAAQDVALSGWVIDDSGGVPVAEALVTFRGVESRTGADGSFVLDLPGPSASEAVDTLTVVHAAYRPLRMAFDTRDWGAWGVEMRLTPRREATTSGAARERARAELDRPGARLWPRESFDLYVEQAEHVLELVGYSGLIYEISGFPGVEWCLRIRPGVDCASILVEGEDHDWESLAGLDPGWMDSAVVIPPVPDVPGRPPDMGVVMIFLTPPPS